MPQIRNRFLAAVKPFQLTVNNMIVNFIHRTAIQSIFELCYGGMGYDPVHVRLYGPFSDHH